MKKPTPKRVLQHASRLRTEAFEARVEAERLQALANKAQLRASAAVHRAALKAFLAAEKVDEALGVETDYSPEVDRCDRSLRSARSSATAKIRRVCKDLLYNYEYCRRKETD